MRLVNLTRKPKRECARLVNYAVNFVDARDHIDTIVLANINESHGYCLRGSEKSLVVVQLSPDLTWPIEYKYPNLRGAPRYTMRSWQEHVLATCCHEAAHAVQFQVLGRTSEIKAERAALACLRSWRSR